MGQLKDFFLTDEALGTFMPIVVYWIYSGIYYLLQPLNGYRMHTPKEENLKNLVSRSAVVKGVLLQQSIQSVVALSLFAGRKCLFCLLQTISNLILVLCKSNVLHVSVFDEDSPSEHVISECLIAFYPDCSFVSLHMHLLVGMRFSAFEEKLSKALSEVTKNTVEAGSTSQPSLIVQARQFLIAMVVLDTWQYFLHRYMHHNKFLYRYIHSQHHKLIVPYAFGALYNHPLEGLLLDTIGGALSFLFSGMTPRTSIFFFSFSTIKTVDDHCGLWLPGNPFHILFQNNTAYHDIHHQLYGAKYNFEQPFFVMWDKILGTYMPYSIQKRADGGLEARPDKS